MTTKVSDLDLVNDGNRLSAGIVLPESPRASIVLLHGIPSVSPSDPNDPGYPGLAERFAREGLAAAWADLRAVRGSEGFFSIEGWVRDVRAVVDAVRGVPGLDELPLVLAGSSAGGAVSTEAVRRGARVDFLALLAAPATWVSYAVDARSAADRITLEAGMPLAPEVVEDPTAWAEEFDGVETERSVKDVRVPILVVHGSADDVVPVDHAHRIAKNAQNADVVILDGATHQLRKEPRAVEAVREWLKAQLG
jgi:alpha-beta hydrolase superfamily lysophospholipase